MAWATLSVTDAWWVQSFNYGAVLYVGERGVLIFDTLEGVYDNICAGSWESHDSRRRVAAQAP